MKRRSSTESGLRYAAPLSVLMNRFLIPVVLTFVPGGLCCTSCRLADGRRPLSITANHGDAPEHALAILSDAIGRGVQRGGAVVFHWPRLRVQRNQLSSRVIRLPRTYD